MMLTRLMALMCFIVCLNGCVPRVVSENPSKSIEMRDVERKVPYFTKVYVEGPFDVNLHTNKHQAPGVKIHASTNDLRKIKTSVKNGVLYVVMSAKKGAVGKKRYRPAPLVLEINIPKFNAFAYKGAGVIEGRHIKAAPFDLCIENSKTTTLSGWIGLRRLTVIGEGSTKISGVHSRMLAVKLKGAPHVEVRGDMNLRSLDVDGDGSLTMYTIKSYDLVIRAKGNARIKLVGTVNRIDGVFSERTLFDAHYLKIKEAFIKTNGESVADIAVSGKQHALARDKSDIYWYNLPYMRTDFMARNGSILDMRPDSLKMVQPDKIYDH